MKHHQDNSKNYCLTVVISAAIMTMSLMKTSLVSNVWANESKSHGKQTTSDKNAHEDKHENEEKPHSDEHGGDEHGEEEGEEGGSRFGPGKAIMAANRKDGIKLSETAIKTLGLSYQPISGEGKFSVPAKSAVYSKDELGVYRYRDGWFKFIDVELINKTDAVVMIKTSELKSGDQIVKDGVALLRAAELEAWGGSGDGHGH